MFIRLQNALKVIISVMFSLQMPLCPRGPPDHKENTILCNRACTVSPWNESELLRLQECYNNVSIKCYWAQITLNPIVVYHKWLASWAIKGCIKKNIILSVRKGANTTTTTTTPTITTTAHHHYYFLWCCYTVICWISLTFSATPHNHTTACPWFCT